MDGWKVSNQGGQLKLVRGPCWAVVTFYRAYGGRDVPDSHVVESLHKDRPEFEHYVARYQYPAHGSIKLYDFAYGRMATTTAYREHWSTPTEFVDLSDDWLSGEEDDQPGLEKVYRKVEIVHLRAAELDELYVDWARGRVLHEGDPASLEFARHVLAELGGEI
jgi:hypothetical protein